MEQKPEQEGEDRHRPGLTPFRQRENPESRRPKKG
jgi:hypothetical protein